MVIKCDDSRCYGVAHLCACNRFGEQRSCKPQRNKKSESFKTKHGKKNNKEQIIHSGLGGEADCT